MKIKNKGKVHPCPSSSSSSDGNVLSVLKLLPAAILALASVLSLEDREVLAYMITRSLDSSIVPGTRRRPSKKPFPHKSNIHKPPLFDCDCFDCYTSYWFRWDSSPNRELIHQVIDAFEDHLANGENAKKNGARGKKKDKTTRPLVKVPLQNAIDLQESPASDVDDNRGVAESQDYEAPPSISPGGADNAEADAQPETEKSEIEIVTAKDTVSSEAAEEEEEEEAANLALPASAASEHRGLARKVLPDVLGLLNSRLWNLWSPNV